MPLFGKTASKVRDFLGSDVGQVLARTASRLLPGDPYNAILDMRQQRAQQQQQADALNALMAQIQPDTMTPQVNELIGGANQRGAQVGMGPMARMQQRPAFDFARPEARQAFVGAMQAGINPQFALDISKSMQPEPRKFVNVGGGRYGYADPENGEVEMAPPDPLQQQLLQAQIAALQAQAGQRQAQGQAAMIRANRPPAAARAGGAMPAPAAGAPWMKYGGGQ